MKDYFTERLRYKGKAEEDRYFAECDQKLLENLRRLHRSANSKTHETGETTGLGK